VELSPNLHLLRVDGWQLYLWHDDDALTLIDAGPPGGGDAVLEAIRRLGFSPANLTGVVLTHFHVDHAGAAAEIRAATGAPVIAHAADAPFVRGEKPPPPPRLEDWEVPLMARTSAGFSSIAPPATPVDREVTGGEVLDFGGGARILAIPGHTDGSIAVHLPDHRALFTGDTVAHWQGRVMLGTFNLDRARTVESFRSLAELDVELACFGHGEPVPFGAGARLRAAVEALQ
jgi:glyoxylase-like metal-dependent hydrolase (beta-lactamase superfamily II)